MNENTLRNIIRKFLQESFQQEILDLILDKISKYGVKSLTPHEKELLKDMSQNENSFNSDRDILCHFLDFNIGKLRGESYSTEKIAKKVSGIKYFSKDNQLIFDLEVDSEVLGLMKHPNSLYVNRKLHDLLDNSFAMSEKEIKNIIQYWFTQQTFISPSSFDYFSEENLI